jgi:proprotein convertase subtilisin/kexin type 5
VCATCDYSCMTCVSGTECVSCDASKYRQLTTKCTCMDGYYDVAGASLMQCATCLVECEKCVDGATCGKCKTENHRTLTNDRCPCDVGYY